MKRLQIKSSLVPVLAIALGLFFSGCQLFEPITGKKQIEDPEAAAIKEAVDGDVALELDDEVPVEWVIPPTEDPKTYQLAVPTGVEETSLLMVSAQVPGKLLRGQPFNYTVTLDNLTDDLLLRDVELHVVYPDEFGEMHGQAVEEQPDGEDHVVYALGILRPGEDREVSVQGFFQEEGLQATYLTVTYDPAVYWPLEVDESELLVTLEAPEESAFCESIPLTVTVENLGSKTRKGLTLSSVLPEGLVMENDRKAFRATIGELKKESTWTSTVYVKGEIAGVYKNVVQVVDEDGGVVMSNQARTAIYTPLLLLESTGPDREEVDTLVTFKVRVSNVGKVTAENIRVLEQLAEGVEYIESDPVAMFYAQNDLLEWHIEKLAPGESIIYNITVQPGDEELERCVATVTADCYEAVEAEWMAEFVDLDSLDISTTPTLTRVSVVPGTVEKPKEQMYISKSGEGYATTISFDGDMADTTFMSFSGPINIISSGSGNPLEGLALPGMAPKQEAVPVQEPTVTSTKANDSEKKVDKKTTTTSSSKSEATRMVE